LSPSQYCIWIKLLALARTRSRRSLRAFWVIPSGNPSQTNCYHRPVNHPANQPIPRDLRTVFLDRDGILNEKMPEGEYVTRWEDFHVLPGVPQALRRLNDAGLRVVVVTNQRGIARGLYTLADVEGIHTKFQQQLRDARARIDAFFICPHDKGQCNCRKPLPGLFEQAVAQFPSITSATSVMIGDSLSDVKFARQLGITSIFIEGNPDRRGPHIDEAAALADLRFDSLPATIDALLAMNVVKLQFDGVTVGMITNPFENDGVWYGSFQIMIDPERSELSATIASYVDFVTDWNERVRSGLVADVSEFDHFSDVVKSQKWTAVDAGGISRRIVDAPVFFRGNEISWRID
jgi:D-glycero-D-manno-heptose 1,7-bisphosphate phosphatase